MKNRHTTPLPKKLDRWTAAARGKVEASRKGKPSGELNQIILMDKEWSKLPNTLLEDATGQLWLAFVHGYLPSEIDPEGGFEAVTVQEGLEWIQNVSEYADGWDGDVADVCRIALAELARRPADLERVKAAFAEEAEWRARTKPGRARQSNRRR